MQAAVRVAHGLDNLNLRLRDVVGGALSGEAT